MTPTTKSKVGCDDVICPKCYRESFTRQDRKGWLCDFCNIRLNIKKGKSTKWIITVSRRKL